MNDLLKKVKKAAGANELFIVGGWLRDSLLGRKNRDLDFATSGDIRAIARKASRTLGGSFVELDPENDIYRVVLKDSPELSYLDFARLKGPDILADLGNRDFTVNSLAYSVPASGEIDLSRILDPRGGMTDLKKKVVRATSDRTFTDDPLRLLRLFRVAAELGFRADPTTRRAATARRGLIAAVAGERVREELFRILALDCASVWVREMEKIGLLDVILPEIVPMKRSARRFYFHPKGLWQHTVESMIALEDLLARLGRFFPGYGKKVAGHLAEPLSSGVTRASLLKFVALMHDVAKPSCAVREGGRVRFHGHDTMGAEMIAAILARLRLGRREIRIARRLVEQHMRPASLARTGMLSRRALYRITRDLGDDLPDLLLLALSDWHSYKRLDLPVEYDLKRQERAVRKVMSYYFDEKEKPRRPRLVNGSLLMQTFGLKPGPVIGELIAGIEEAQSMGTVSTTEDALAFAEKQLTTLKKKYILT